MLENIKSGEEYGELLVNRILEIDDNLPADLLEIWCDQVYKLAVESYKDYLLGVKDDFALTVEEMEQSYKKSAEILTAQVLGDMVDKELIKTGIDENGEIVYSLTEKGQELKDSLKD